MTTASTRAAQVVVLAKEPRPGHSKTRLTPPLSPAQAAAVARASLLDSLDAVLAVPVVARTVVLDGSPAGWMPSGLAVLPQVDGDLGARLDAAFHAVHGERPLPVLLIGMDTPQVTAADLTSAVDQLLAPGTDAVLGHATDGGWWALGLRRPAPGLFDDVPMSTARAGAVQQQRLEQAGLRTALLPELRDVDHAEDLQVLSPLLDPASRLARLLPTLEVVSA